MKHSLFGFRPTRHLALGLGAAGLVLGASGATAAATALVQPAGALSVQVPAVAVREQNVNAAGRIRVALPKGGVGVNGSVSVNNLPVPGEPHWASWNGQVGTTPVTILNLSGSGYFNSAEIGNNGGGSNPSCQGLTVIIDGNVAFQSPFGLPHGYPFLPSSVLNGAPNAIGGWAMNFLPRQPLAFQHSLVVQSEIYSCAGAGSLATSAYLSYSVTS